MDTILIVEDEKLIRQGIRSMIEHSDVPVARILDCRNGEEALHLLKSEKVDLIITDIRMPKMDGITLMKQLIAKDDKTATIVISGYDDFTYAVDVLRCGAIDYILKPVDRKVLVSLLKKIEDDLKQKVIKETEKKSALAYQLRYLFLQNDLPMEELKDAWKDFEEELESCDYYVIAAKPGILHLDFYYNSTLSEALRHGIVLKKVEDMDIVIAKASYVPKDVLEDKVLGFSAICNDKKEIKEAYIQAVQNRKRKFFAAAKEMEEIASIDDIGKNIIETSNYLLLKKEELIKQLAGMFRATQDNTLTYLRVETMLKQLLKHMNAQYGSLQGAEDKLLHPYCYCSVNEYFMALQEYITGLFQILAKAKSANSTDKMRAALDYIDKNYSMSLNMAVISNYISMNYSLFSNAFKQYTGENFVTYLHKTRIEKAKELLCSTDEKMKDIGFMVGFEDEKHFYRIFRQISGVSPKEYRTNMMALKRAK
jgi:YesN/AraC family two-component response regulator